VIIGAVVFGIKSRFDLKNKLLDKNKEGHYDEQSHFSRNKYISILMLIITIFGLIGVLSWICAAIYWPVFAFSKAGILFMVSIIIVSIIFGEVYINTISR